LIRNAEVARVFGHEIRVASLEDVIRPKEAANRPKDREALSSLRELQSMRARLGQR